MFHLFEQESQKSFSQGISDSQINGSSENQQRMLLKHTTPRNIHVLQEATEYPLDGLISGHGWWNINGLWEIIEDKLVCLSGYICSVKVMQAK